MKFLKYLFILFVPTVLVFAQSYPKIEYVKENESIFTGYIVYNDTYLPITMYLNYYQSSIYYLDLYSVKGWYYYDKYEEKTPLVGITDGREIVLFHFNDPKEDDYILELQFEEGPPKNISELCDEITNYDEEFCYSSNNDENSWKKGNKELRFYFNNTSDRLNIRESKVLLRLDSGHTFNLFGEDHFKSNYASVKVVAQKNNRLILSYTLPGNLNVNGRCGAGEDSGYIFIEYDAQKSIKMYKDYLVEPCSGLNWEQKQKGTTSIYQYSSEVEKYDVIIDFKNVTMERKNK